MNILKKTAVLLIVKQTTMKLYSLIILFAALTISGLQAQANTTDLPDLKSAGEISLKTFAGTWYEISRIPNPVDSDLYNVTITYVRKGDNKLKETLKGNKANGKSVKVKSNLTYSGDGHFDGPIGGKYIILAIDEKMQYCMLGTPDRKYLWILSRSNTMKNNTYNTLVIKANKMGFSILLMQMNEYK